MRILITIVNYNTQDLLSHLIYSLFRVIGHRPLRNCTILIVDNSSTDGSRALIKALKQKGLVGAIFNKKQLYHARGLNQGLEVAINEDYDVFWAIDSDVVILRRRIIRDAINSLEGRKVDMMAQCNNAGESHVSCMMLRVSTAKRLRASFAHGGNPSRYLEKQYHHSNARVRNFPFRNSYYILHAGCGTRKVVKETGDSNNAWFDDIADCSPWYHGDPLAPIIHDDFKQIFLQEVPVITPEALCEACLRRDRVKLQLPPESPGLDPRVLSPTARGRRARRALDALRAIQKRSGS